MHMQCAHSRIKITCYQGVPEPFEGSKGGKFLYWEGGGGSSCVRGFHCNVVAASSFPANERAVEKSPIRSSLFAQYNGVHKASATTPWLIRSGRYLWTIGKRSQLPPKGKANKSRKCGISSWQELIFLDTHDDQMTSFSIGWQLAGKPCYMHLKSLPWKSWKNWE